MHRDEKVISVVIPVYNEAENISELYGRIKKVEFSTGYRFEIIFVNDGSTDNSLETMRGVARADKQVKIIDLSRNFGHQIAIKAGLGFISGDAVVIMDADLQDSPEFIERMVNKWREGYHVVYAIRRSRKENFFLRFLYASFYRLLKTMSNIDIPLDAGDFCLMDRQVADILVSMPERHPFIRGLRSWVGYKQIGIEFERKERFRGKTKYSIFKLIELALDGIFSFSNVPLRLIAIMGFVISAVSFLLIIYLFVYRLPMPGVTAVAMLVLFIGGVQLITIGVLGEYVVRIYEESKKRPVFLIKEKINI